MRSPSWSRPPQRSWAWPRARPCWRSPPGGSCSARCAARTWPCTPRGDRMTGLVHVAVSLWTLAVAALLLLLALDGAFGRGRAPSAVERRESHLLRACVLLPLGVVLLS